jgi:hypothetical protein
MSFRATECAWAQPLDGRKKLLLLAIAHEADKSGTGACRATQERLAEYCGCSVRQVRRLPTAYGDLTAVVLALLTLASVQTESPLAIPMVWLFNIVGLLDLIYANFATFTYHVDPVQLGASYYLAVVNVPAMVVIHIMIFAYLLSPRSAVSAHSSAFATGQRRDR